ncbi:MULTISPECIES: efflux RND transporter periplasmic adaptor subunit [Leeuwenhoekiella]|jgi:membrane fusion protein (multidrug efflux system)|uniref:Secretion protein HlyD n=1 Tax=Leeuwenhoekiella blandensis (strain CECT 7118 / CCUG 51940 / KCTC 22103 / MED217) TaxID=398720 RepID=A3XQL7_LEEBM|nr:MULTISPECIES: efflux RND transporter periplasmic adaptor subunit [Leeuwenhoekiella]EAQ48161.1 Secretion protein HlyD [Leeuwenhoekiella blandensis MED217]MAO44049.1 efflux RND transporter periplasmic adaptor subunit [Leeuwenhoekiella sp.]HBT08137.1 efflux RND transporter periplasmic adaptor subunit [Leeuwenhoekiella sp.]HCW65535.1 efflux RND transporter periplasmic adaptor subunit [Leeuwenhoekiella sp.]|tara:strand:- start:1417 stop:2553 length:1137 start_codon:yes stop_codon:yes gene_type:complete
MKKRIFNYLVPALLGVLVFTSCGDDKSSGEAQGQAQQVQQLPVISIPQQTLTGYSSYPASIEGIVNSGVRAKIQGYISDVLVDEGAKVRKGQPLFKLETQSLTQDANAARANVNAAQVEVDKLKPLVEKNIISSVQLETAKAQLEQAKSSYESIAANISYATVKSPVDGYVGAIPYREGALVGPSDTTPLTTVADIEQVYAFFSMNESEYLNFIQKTEGSSLQEKIENFPEVVLILANGKEYEHKGKIETVTAQVDRTTGTVSFRAIFDNPNQLITNGNSGTLKIPNVYSEVPVVPLNSTFEQQGKIIAYKVDSNNKAQTTEIIPRATIGNLYVVASGVEPGDKIIAKGANKVRPGTTIQPNEVPFDSIAKPAKQIFQ